MKATEASLFADPIRLPLRTIGNLAGPVLVVAPHPDDETLGCGGAIALLRSQQTATYILVISDGSMSHPRSKRYPAHTLKKLRQTETLKAMEILSVPKTAVSFLQWQDGAVPHQGSPGFGAAVHHCQTYLATLPPLQTIFVPWRDDPHPDHRATWQIIQAAVKARVRLLEYPIWDWDEDQRGVGPKTARFAPWRLDIGQVVPLKMRAIHAYRSQTTSLIEDDPTGFQLSAPMLQQFSLPWELYIEAYSELS